MSQKVYEIVTDQIVKELSAGNIPWHKPWKNAYNVRMPHNLISKKGYKGINIWLLAFAPYDSPYFLTFKQCKDLGGKVKKGEKGYLVVFWKVYDKDVVLQSGETEKQKRYILRYYKVFNTEQCEGLDEKMVKFQNNIDNIDFNPIEKCEEIVENMPNRPTITHDSQRAFFNHEKDLVNLPKKDSFDNEEEYYSTSFHELGHSTGHKSRLNRKEMNLMESHAYSKEELVAELTSAFLCGVSGIEQKTIANSTAYIKNWCKAFKNDAKMVVEASQKAQKAADHILDEEK